MKRRMIYIVFENVDVEKHTVYIVNLLTAIRWVNEERESVAHDCISKIFKHCFSESTSLLSLADREEGDLSDVFRRYCEEKGVQPARNKIKDLLNPDGEDDVSESVNDKLQVMFIWGDVLYCGRIAGRREAEIFHLRTCESPEKFCFMHGASRICKRWF